MEYAWRFADEYSACLFISAPSPEEFRRNLAELTTELGIAAGVTEEQGRFQATLDWLGRDNQAEWLLILDNVDTDDVAVEVRAHLPRLAKGHVIVTSRLSNWAGGVEPMELGVLEPEDATKFLLERTNGRSKQDDDVAQAEGLARDLDGLALALEQAGAFVVARRKSLAEYRRRWNEADKKVHEWFKPEVSQYPKSVAKTWQTTFDELSTAARALLRILCWLAPDPLPSFLFDGAIVGQGGIKLGADDDAAAEDALEELIRYSFLQPAKEAEFESPGQIHRVFAAVTRSREPNPEQTFAVAVALVEAAAQGSPQDVRTWRVWDPLRAHVAQILAVAEQRGHTKSTTRLMSQLALLFMVKGDSGEAEPLMRRTLSVAESSYDAGHPEVARALNDLASLLGGTSRFVEA